MTAQDPSTSRNAAQQWRHDAYAAGCLKRAVVRRPTEGERRNGLHEVVVAEIIMRHDQPGVFYDIQGKPVDDATARAAGFDVTRWKLAGEKQRRKAEALARIEEEYARIEAGAEADGPAEA